MRPRLLMMILSTLLLISALLVSGCSESSKTVLSYDETQTGIVAGTGTDLGVYDSSFAKEYFSWPENGIDTTGMTFGTLPDTTGDYGKPIDPTYKGGGDPYDPNDPKNPGTGN